MSVCQHHPCLKITRLLLLCLAILGLSACDDDQLGLAAAGIDQALEQRGIPSSPYMIVVQVNNQTLSLLKDHHVLASYPISTSKKGLGQTLNSYQTPKGVHRIVEKIGHEVPYHGIFHRREYIGAVWEPVPHSEHHKDYIVTRVLRLKGLEPGLNAGRNRRGQNVDSEARAIYIHGTTKEWLIGKPSTKGCIHMKNKDLIDLFNRVPVGTIVMVAP